MAAVSKPPLPDSTSRAPGSGGSLLRFTGTRFWTTWVFVAWLKLTAALPWRLAIRIHEAFGRVLWAALKRRRRIVVRNLELCFPELGREAVEALARRHFANVGATIAEVAFAWFAPERRLAPLMHMQGIEHLNAALAHGRGVLLLSGHFSTLEICSPFVKNVVPLFAFMYRPRNNPLLNELQARGRLRASHISFANTDVRALLRALKQNGVVWYAPDQARSGSGAELQTFFGQPAMTNTGTSRIARVSGAAVVPFFFCRLEDGSGYRLRFDAALEGLTGDTTLDTQLVTRVIEGFVRECPAQYLWMHRKFKDRPELPDAYDGPAAAGATAAPDAATAAPQEPPGVTARDATSPRRSRAWLAAPLAILGVAAFITLLDNQPLWRIVLAATMEDQHRLAIVGALFVIVLGTLTTLLALALGNVALKIVGAALLVVAAVAGFFMAEYGVVIDEPMIRNIAETEIREASPLLTSSFFVHLLLYGILPAALLVWLPLPKVPWRRALTVRAAVLAIGVGAIVAIVYANYGALAFFARQNDSVRLWINPGYPIHAALQYYTDANVKPERKPLAAMLAPSRAARAKPRLVIFVMGETARADRWSFNGYARDTNKYTRPLGVVNFPHVESCGTSTAESVPCIFSGLGREGFSHAAAAARESLFGAFQRLGIESFWRDNSTGCKEVCDPAHFEQFATRKDADFCDATGCFDEILLKGLDGLVADATSDRFIVLHQRGSHGPAYHTDVPAALKEFLPECDLPNLRNCNRDEINNAYDNTILYSDYFLARVIDFLGKHSAAYEVAMLYVSDHGESLGDNGLYLHGFPRALAPEEQIRVPMLFWASPELYASAHIDRACVAATADRPLTHDSMFHTLLALLDLQSPEYRAALDLFAGCRGEPPAASASAAR